MAQIVEADARPPENPLAKPYRAARRETASADRADWLSAIPAPGLCGTAPRETAQRCWGRRPGRGPARPGHALAVQSTSYNRIVPSGTLPGQDLIEAGLVDLERGVESVPALLVSIGAPRLRRLSVRIPRVIPLPEHRLYELLHQSDPDSAHSRYNALVRRLVSFERAAECAR